MKRPSAGYTILESLIFLAVSGVLFALIVPTFIGRQDNVRFSESVRDLDNKIQDVINDVSTGYFPSSDIKCYVDNTNNIKIEANGGTQQGTRKDCVFLGKVIAANGSSANRDLIDTLTVVGKRQVNGHNSQTIAEATPTAVAPDTNDAAIPNLTETYQTKWGLKVNKITVVNSSTPINMSAFAVMSKLSGNTSGGQVDIVPMGGTTFTESRQQLATDIKSYGLVNGWDASNVNRPGGILMCLTDASDKRQAAILIGGRAGIAKTEVIFDTPNIDGLGSGICS